jgi:hypothetical protein
VGDRRHSTDVVQVWFDDDAGVVVRVSGAGRLAGELTVPLFEDGGASAEDVRFIDDLVGRKLLTKTAARSLKSRLNGPPKKRDAWILGHGVERAFGLRSSTPPSGGAAAKPGPRKAARKKAAPARRRDGSKASSPGRHRLPADARPTLNLHIFYWTHVWCMNSWSLYYRYKKHLPAADRRQVDELCNAAAMGKTKEIPARVEKILAQTWHEEDWAAFIRNPKLDDSGTGKDTLRRWREMTGRGETLDGSNSP